MSATSSRQRNAAGAAILLCFAGLLHARVYDADELFARQGLGKASLAARTAAVEGLAAALRPGDVLGLPRDTRLGKLNFAGIANNVQIEYGAAEEIDLGTSGKTGLSFIGVMAKIKGSNISNSSFSCASAVEGSNLAANTYLWTGVGSFGTTTLKVTGSMTDCRYFYVWYHDVNVSADGNGGPFIWLDVGDTKGSVIYQVVEHNYCESKPQVLVKGAQNLFYGPGDTERQRPASACYLLQNTNVVLFGHRCFSGSRGNCSNATTGVSYRVQGGAPKFVYSYDIGAPKGTSLDAGTADGLELWGAWMEDKISEGSNAFRALATEQGMTTQQDQWTEPTQVDGEYIIKHSGIKIKGTDTNVPNNPGVSIPAPPMIASPAIKGMPKARLGRSSRSWGAELLAAGADPTGRRSSLGAFRRVIATRRVVEVPPGTFLLDEPLVIDESSPMEQMLGAGDDVTVLRATHGGPIITEQGPQTGLAREGTASRAREYNGQTFDGGSIGLEVTCYKCGLTPGGSVFDCTFKNQSQSGIHVTGTAHEMDQVKIYNTKFYDIGEYGIRIDLPMIDKEGYLKLDFRNIGKAGIFLPGCMMFAGTIYECAFENINGPGVDFYPVWDYNPGYPPHCSMINKCRFVNCGNRDRGALDWGFNENGGVVDCKVTITDGRSIRYGIVGTGPYFDRCTVQVDNGDITAASFGFRNNRRLYNGRPAGSIVRNCYANNKGMAFVYGDVPDVGGSYGRLPLQQSAAGATTFQGLKWWQAADPSTLYPWAYSHLMYGSKFGPQDIGYILFRNNVRGENLQQVAFSGQAVSLDGALVRRGSSAPSGGFDFYDLRGRRVAGALPRFSPAATASRGAYLARQRADGAVRRRLVVR